MTDLLKKIRESAANGRSVCGKTQCLLERTQNDKAMAYEVNALLNYAYQQYRATYVILHHSPLEEQVQDAFVAHMEKSY